MSAPLAALCAKCSAELHEGRTAHYDSRRDEYFCDRGCFTDWFSDNVDKLAAEYYGYNVGQTQL